VNIEFLKAADIRGVTQLFQGWSFQGGAADTVIKKTQLVVERMAVS